MNIEDQIEIVHDMLAEAAELLESQAIDTLKLEKRIKTLEDKVTNLAGDNTARIMSENISNRTMR